MTKEKALVFLSRIEKEMSLLKQTLDTIGKRLETLKTKRGTDDFPAYVESLALNLQSFYEGIETIFEKVLDFTGEDKPTGTEWHMELLERMTLPIKKLRPEVISADTAKQLDALRAFRHKIRHIYSFMIIPENTIRIAQNTGIAFDKLQNDIKIFSSFIEEIAAL